MVSWMVRILGWLLISAAVDMFLSPLKTFLDIIPIVGYLGNCAISILSGIVSLILTLLIISMAYLVYHPSVGIPMVAFVVAAFIVTPYILNQKLEAKQA